MRKRPSAASSFTVSIVGPGKLGTALALSLPSAACEVKAIAVRPKSDSQARAQALARKLQARVVQLGKSPLDTQIVWLAVPDDAISEVARLLAPTQPWERKIVFHSSGALSSDELAPLREKGAYVASVHPMMTFLHSSVPQMDGVAFAIEGDTTATRAAKVIVSRLRGRAFHIEKENKVLYHAFGSFASPLLVALLAELEQVGRAAGLKQSDVRRAVRPLITRTLQNYFDEDASSAFTGPLARGDIVTIRKHLRELKKLPDSRAVYLALARAAVKRLPVKNRTAIAKLLRS